MFSILRSFREWSVRQEFDPGPWGFLVNPHAICRRNIIRHLREFAPNISGDILDVGCGRGPYRRIFSKAKYHGVDLERSVTTNDQSICVYDGKTLPYPDATFDAILCTQVLEHVFEPQKFLREIRRVIKPGGKLILTVPFIWPEHEMPHDSARYTTPGLQQLLSQAGFKIHEHYRVTTGGTAIMQLIVSMLSESWNHPNRLYRWFVRCSLMMAQIFLSPILLIRSKTLYLDNICLANTMEYKSQTTNDSFGF